MKNVILGIAGLAAGIVAYLHFTKTEQVPGAGATARTSSQVTIVPHESGDLRGRWKTGPQAQTDLTEKPRRQKGPLKTPEPNEN